MRKTIFLLALGLGMLLLCMAFPVEAAEIGSAGSYSDKVSILVSPEVKGPGGAYVLAPGAAYLLTVEVRDCYNRPVRGALVFFEVACNNVDPALDISGGAFNVEPALAVTDVRGMATAAFTAPVDLGQAVITVRVSGRYGVEVLKSIPLVILEEENGWAGEGGF
ncbi:hypothetical protein [Desulfofundulus sp.]|uniref:hypothetical protein n=1 Tax=Desulfofundulus sp. TaxID=2282750 RepID=UPI003C712447